MQTTKEKFAEAIKTELQQQPLDKITVKDIVHQSGLSRQTFYRHFLDKYDLVNWYFERLILTSFKEMGEGKTLQEALYLKFSFIEREHRFFKQAFKSTDYNNLKRFDYDCIYAFYKERLEQEGVLDSRFSFLLAMYCRGSVAMTVDWILQDMNVDKEEMVSLLVEAIPKPLEEVFIRQKILLHKR